MLAAELAERAVQRLERCAASIDSQLRSQLTFKSPRVLDPEQTAGTERLIERATARDTESEREESERQPERERIVSDVVVLSSVHSRFPVSRLQFSYAACLWHPICFSFIFGPRSSVGIEGLRSRAEGSSRGARSAARQTNAVRRRQPAGFCEPARLDARPLGAGPGWRRHCSPVSRVAGRLPRGPPTECSECGAAGHCSGLFFRC